MILALFIQVDATPKDEILYIKPFINNNNIYHFFQSYGLFAQLIKINPKYSTMILIVIKEKFSPQVISLLEKN